MGYFSKPKERERGVVMEEMGRGIKEGRVGRGQREERGERDRIFQQTKERDNQINTFINLQMIYFFSK